MKYEESRFLHLTKCPTGPIKKLREELELGMQKRSKACSIERSSEMEGMKRCHVRR
jgi:hypothetical protein